MAHTDTPQHAAMLRDMLAHANGTSIDARTLLDSVTVPAVATTAPPRPEVVACNAAFTQMCGYAPWELCGQSPSTLQGPDTDTAEARDFAERLDKEGVADTRLLNYRKDGSPYHVSIHAARLAMRANGGEPIFVAFEEPDDAIMESAGAADDPRAAALRVEDLMRRMINASYREGMPPSQWAALRYFAAEPEARRNLTTFAKHHRVTMGTASSTVSALVHKGYLHKRAFRGPVDITEEGRAMLARDPVNHLVTALADMPAGSRAETNAVLAALTARLDAKAPQ